MIKSFHIIDNTLSLWYTRKVEERTADMHQELKHYVAIVEFLGKALGKQYEIVLHDFTDPAHAVVAIANGFQSGRNVGSPMTNLAMRMMQDDTAAHGHGKNYIVQHEASGKDGKPFTSSTMLIRDKSGSAIGALCVNFNVEVFMELKSFIDSIGLGEDKPANQPGAIHYEGEVLSDAGNSALKSIYHTVMDKYLNVDISSQQKKQEIINEFYAEGAFLLKGSVCFIADKMAMSEPTVYRYLAKAKQQLKA